MGKLFFWVIVILLIFVGYKAGVFDPVVNYFSESAKQARQEKIIQEEDGSITTVRYRNIFDLLLGK